MSTAVTAPTASEVAIFERGEARVYDAMNAREQGMTNMFDQGPAASTRAKNYLRVLLTKSIDATLVAELRMFFNLSRIHGDRITSAQVSSAIRLLKGE